MSELYLSDVTLRESRPRSRRLRDLGYVVRSYPSSAPASTASGSILDTILIPHYDDAGNLVSLESTVDFWSSKNISAGGLAAGGGDGDGNVSADEDLASSKIVIGDGAKKVKSSSYSILSYLGDDTSSYIKANSVPTTKVMLDYVDAHSGGGGGGNVSTSGTWTKDKIVVSGTNNTVKSEYGIELYDVSNNSGLIPTSWAVKNYVDAHSGGGGGVSQNYVDSHIAGKNVVSTTPTNGQAIVWDATNSRFKWQTISGGGGLSWEALGTDNQEQQISADHIGISDDLNNALSIGSDGKLYAVKSTSGGGGNVSTSGVLAANSIIVGAGSQSVNASGKSIVTEISDPTDNQVPTALAVKTLVDSQGGGNYLRKDISDTAAEKIIFVKGIHIGPANGGIDITYDATTNAIKINGNAYAVGQLAAGGPISSNN